MKKLIYTILSSVTILCSIYSCGQKETSLLRSNYTVKYSHEFAIYKDSTYTHLQIRNPWDTTKVLKSYVLIDKDSQIPDNIPEGIIVRTPVSSVVAYGAIQCAILRELGVVDKITGVCDSHYINDSTITKGVRSGNVINAGNASAPDIETIIMLSPELIMTSPFHNISYGAVEKLGIPILECADYMERTPLGRAEWIKFYSFFFDKEHEADILFNNVENRYNEITKLTNSLEYRPTLLTEKMYGNVWYVPGGDSYMAKMYNDAGANYIWRDNKNSGSLNLSAEKVIEEAIDADFWLIKYNQPNDITYSDISDETSIYKEFAAWKNRRIIAINSYENDFYERFPFNPDILLKDLVKVFHPELMTEHQSVFIMPVET